MTRFLKTTVGMAALAASMTFASCSNEEAMKEEQNAGTVNIEKGVADPMWTSDTNGSSVSTTEGGKVQTIQEVQQEFLEQAQQPTEIVAHENQDPDKKRDASDMNHDETSTAKSESD